MNLPRGRRTQTLLRTGRVLLLTVSLGFTVPAIMAAPIMPPLTPPLVAKGSPRTNNEETIEWNQTYGGPSFDEGSCVKQTVDGGYILTGDTASYGAGGWDAWLIKTDAAGIVEWTQTFGGPGWDTGRWVEQTADGGYILTGHTESYETYFDVWLIKTDATGRAEWTQTFGGPKADQGSWVEQTADGGYILTGDTASYGAGAEDLWLIKTDATGHMEWNQTHGGPSFDWGRDGEQTADGGYILTGNTLSYGAGGWDLWLIKTDAFGHAKWTQTYGGPEWDGGGCVEQTADGGYILAGITMSSGAGEADVWVTKTNAFGHVEWAQTYGGPEWDASRWVEQTADGGYILTGHTASYGAGKSDVWLIKTDAAGHVEWTQTFGGPEEDGGGCVEQTTDGGYILTGDTESFGAGETDVWLIKVSGAGAVTSSEFSEIPWGPVFWALAVIGIPLTGGIVFAKRKR